MTKTILKTLAGVAALGAVAAGASAIAGASDSKVAGASGPAAAGGPMAYGAPGGRPPGAMRFRMRGGPPDVTGATADKVKAAALAKYPGAKVERVVKLPDGTYVAHVIKTDGTEVYVLVNKQFEVTGTGARGMGGPPGGPPGGGPGHGPAVTGATADKVKAAALDKYPGSKIERIDQLPDGTYVAHVIKTDGTELHVTVNKQFEVTGIAKPGQFGPPGGHMPGGRMPGHPPNGANGQMPPPPPYGANGRMMRPQAPPATGSSGSSS